MRFIKYAFLLFIFFLIIENAFGQDPHFSQVQNNPIYLNPANAGFTNDYDNRIVGAYRDQWRTASIPYSTTFGSYDRKFAHWQNGWRIGGGVSLLYDRAADGILGNFSPDLIFAVGKYLNNNRQLLSLGISTGITLRTLNYSKLTFNNQYIAGDGYDPSLSSGENTSNGKVIYPHFTLGLRFATKLGEIANLDIGGTVSNLHQPKQNFLYFSTSKLAPRYAAYLKTYIELGRNGNWNIQPTLVYNFQNKANDFLVSTIAETILKQNRGNAFGLGFGAGYRIQSSDAIIAYLSVLYNGLKIGISYDANISNFKKATKTFGAFEVLFTYSWGESDMFSKKKGYNTKYLSCPSL